MAGAADREQSPKSARDRARARELLAAILVLALACTLPFAGGLLGFLLGLVALLASGQDAADARAHMTELPVTPIAKAQEGAVVRVRGRIVSPASVRSLITDKVVALASVNGFRSLEEGTAALPARRFGADLEIRDESGAAVLDLETYQVLSRHVERAGPARSSSPRIKAALERAYPRFAEADGRFSITEIALEQGDVLEVIGRVVGAEAIEAPSEESYRELHREQRIRLSSPDAAGALLVTTYDQPALAALIADARRTRAIAGWQVALGVVNVAVSAALAWWWLR